MMAAQLDPKKRLALAIIDFLRSSAKDGTVQAEETESMEVATSCIADSFGVDPSNQDDMKSAVGTQSLLSIYNVYDRLRQSQSSASQSDNATSKVNQTSATDSNVDAELLKKKGNGAMAQKDYSAAIDFYSQAVKISPTNPIYLSNRAAAYSAMNNHTAAASDAEMAVASDPNYTKAWSRLGLARYVLGDARGSMEAYQKGIDAEGSGGSDAMKKGFETAKRKVQESEVEGAQTRGMADEVDDASGNSRGAGGGVPDLSALAGMLGGGRGGSGTGGMPDMSSIMQNPMFASMAQNLMSNPDALQGLMNNPSIRQMAERFGVGSGTGSGTGPPSNTGSNANTGHGNSSTTEGDGAGGGMPDLASLMNDPSIAEMARNFMGGAGGGQGRGRGA